MNRFLNLTMFCVMTLALIIGCGSDKKNETESSNENEPIYDSLVITLEGREGISVFDLLDEDHDVGFIGSTIGNFVKAIDSIEINDDFSWLYSVNDSMGRVASDKYITSDSDIVKWHYRKQ